MRKRTWVSHRDHLSLYKESERRHSPQCNIIVLCLVYCWLYLRSTLYSTLFTFYKVSVIACFAAPSAAQHSGLSSLGNNWIASGQLLVAIVVGDSALDVGVGSLATSQY